MTSLTRARTVRGFARRCRMSRIASCLAVLILPVLVVRAEAQELKGPFTEKDSLPPGVWAHDNGTLPHSYDTVGLHDG